MTTTDQPTDQTGDAAASQADSPFSKLLDYGRERGYKLDWLQKQDTWGNELDSGPAGLQLGDVDQGIFGSVPEGRTATRVWPASVNEKMSRLPASPATGLHAPVSRLVA